MKRYCIFGDSWSYQSKTTLPDNQEGVGLYTLQKMFKGEGVAVNNFSVNGTSNKEIVELIKQKNLAIYDCIIVFQTDPLRDIADRKNFTVANTRATSITQLAESLLSTFYQELSKIKKPVLLVGGLSCLAHHLVPDNLHTLDKSWTEMCEPSFRDCYYEWTDFVELVHDNIRFENSDIAEIKEQIKSKNHVWVNSDAIARCHPSDIGYEIMFNALHKKLNELV